MLGRLLVTMLFTLCVTSPGGAQSSGSGVRLTVAGSYGVFPTQLPAQYVMELGDGREVRESGSLSETFGVALHAELTLDEHWAVGGNLAFFATDVVFTVPATRLATDVDLLVFGGDVRRFFGEFYVVAGLGSTRLDPENGNSETGIGWSAGVGRDVGVARVEIRDHMSPLGLDPAEGSTLHHALLLSAGVTIGI